MATGWWNHHRCHVRPLNTWPSSTRKPCSIFCWWLGLSLAWTSPILRFSVAPLPRCQARFANFLLVAGAGPLKFIPLIYRNIGKYSLKYSHTCAEVWKFSKYELFLNYGSYQLFFQTKHPSRWLLLHRYSPPKMGGIMLVLTWKNTITLQTSTN